jgi:hypothetical protein
MPKYLVFKVIGGMLIYTACETKKQERDIWSRRGVIISDLSQTSSNTSKLHLNILGLPVSGLEV